MPWPSSGKAGRSTLSTSERATIAALFLCLPCFLWSAVGQGCGGSAITTPDGGMDASLDVIGPDHRLPTACTGTAVLPPLNTDTCPFCSLNAGVVSSCDAGPDAGPIIRCNHEYPMCAYGDFGVTCCGIGFCANMPDAPYAPSYCP